MTICDDVRALRARLGEDTTTFGARWHRSGRTVEQWEQGRRRPDPLVIEGIREGLASLAARGKPAHAKPARRRTKQKKPTR
jgi:hypothetical protein